MDYSSGLYSTSTTTTSNGAVAAFLIGYFIFLFIILAIMIISNWKIYQKAGKRGWEAIIPIYNYIVLLEIIGRPLWWVILLLIPLVNIVVLIIVSLDLAKSFGKSTAFAVFGLIIFSLIGYPMLAFGNAKYLGPAGPEGKTPAQPSTPTPAPAA